MLEHDIVTVRQALSAQELDQRSADRDPFRQFGAWFADAQAAQLTQPDAMTLATATKDGAPSARMVLLKGFDERGFVFFTNYESRKGRELAENPSAALVFWWADIRRQVRIQGTVVRVSDEESDAYFATRPRGSQLSAAASRQSTVIPGREVLQARVAELNAESGGRDVPRPSFWGGYCLVPNSIEFWHGRPDRLHDRLLYQKLDNGEWEIVRLSP